LAYRLPGDVRQVIVFIGVFAASDSPLAHVQLRNPGSIRVEGAPDGLKFNSDPGQP
jgi:hypothetical protein